MEEHSSKERKGISKSLKRFFGVGDFGFNFMTNIETYCRAYGNLYSGFQSSGCGSVLSFQKSSRQVFRKEHGNYLLPVYGGGTCSGIRILPQHLDRAHYGKHCPVLLHYDQRLRSGPLRGLRYLQ